MGETCYRLCRGYLIIVPLLAGLELHLLLLFLQSLELFEEQLLVFIKEVLFMFDLFHFLSGPILFRRPSIKKAPFPFEATITL